MMTPARAMREVFGEVLAELAGEYPNLLCLDGDLGNSTRLDIMAAKYPERFLQMGIAEQNMMGVAAGLAAMGYAPFTTTFACFAVKRALDQIRVLIAQPSLKVTIVGAYSGILTGRSGKTHQSIQDITVMRAMPNMVTLVPVDGVELRQMMRAIMLYEGPVYLRLTRDPSPTVLDDGYRFEMGKAVSLRSGSDVSIISTGVQTARAMEAASMLEVEGIRAGVLHVPTIKPLDEAAIVAEARRTGLIVTAEDHTVLGGLGGAVAEVLAENHPTPMRRLGWKDTFGESGPDDDLLEKYGLTAAHVARTVRDAMAAFKH